MSPPIGRRSLLRQLGAAWGALLTTRNSSALRLAQPRTRSTDFTALQRRIRGRVTSRENLEYEALRRGLVWNGRVPDRFPQAIVQARSAADAREAVRFAGDHDLRVAIRGAGHNWHNPVLQQGGLLLDLSGLSELHVDAAKRTATVQPGINGAMLMAQLAPHGLAFPIGHEPRVPMSGYLLNGGLGWNYRVWGPACASVTAIELIDAHGVALLADRDHHADLFWAARGAGPGFFGVVTRLHLRAHQLPRAMLRSTLVYSIDDTERLAEWLTRLVPLDPSAELICSFSAGRWYLTAVSFAANSLEAHRVLEPLESAPAALPATQQSLYQDVDVEAVFGRVDAQFAPGPRYAGDTLWSNASPQELMSSVRSNLSSAPAGGAVEFVWLSRAANTPPSDMAYAMPGTTYVHAHTAWHEAAEDEAMTTWTRETIAALEPLAAGYYVGESELTLPVGRARGCFTPTAWDRLALLKRRYDPDERFYSSLPWSAR
jgi:FAD/FMN-containing dehydrogenase